MTVTLVIEPLTARCFHCGDRKTNPAEPLYRDAAKPAYVETYYCRDCAVVLS